MGDTSRIRLASISSRAWEHPADRGALVGLRKLQGFDLILKQLSGFLNERAVRMLMLHFRDYLDFIQGQQGLDVFLGVEPDDFVKFVHIWQTCLVIGGYLMIDRELPDLAQAVRKDVEAWKEPFYSLHNQTLDMLLKELEPYFLEVLKKSHKRIVETDAAYWRHTDPSLQSLCKLISPDEWHLR